MNIRENKFRVFYAVYLSVSVLWLPIGYVARGQTAPLWTWIDPQPTGAFLNCVACSETNCVAVGEKGVVLLSSDGGATWATRYSPVRLDLSGVQPWQGGFLVWGSGGVLQVQPPSSITSLQLIGSGLQVTALTVVSNVLIVAAFDSANQRTLVLASMNAQSWTTNFTLNDFSVTTFASNPGITLLAGRTISSGQAYILRSTNLLSWNTITFNPGNTLQIPSTQLCAAGGYFFDLPFMANYFYKSSNGLDWVSNSLPQSANTVFKSVSEGAGTFVFVGSFYSTTEGNKNIRTTTDFVNWKSFGGGGKELVWVSKSSSRMVAVGTYGLICSAPLGTDNWGFLNSGDWQGIYNNLTGGRCYRTTFFSNLDLILDGQNELYSSDGRQWFTNLLPTMFWAICAGNGRVVARDGQFPVNAWVSTNGLDWQLSGSMGKIYADGFLFGNGVFAAIRSDASDYLTSSNGVTWSTNSNPLAVQIVGFTGGTWFGLNSNYTTICISQDLQSWAYTPLVFPVASVGQVLAWKNMFAILGYLSSGGVWISSNLTTSTKTFAVSPNQEARRLFSMGDTLFLSLSDGSLHYTTNGIDWTVSDFYLPSDGSVSVFSNKFVMCSDQGIAYSDSNEPRIQLDSVANSILSLSARGIPGSEFRVSESSDLQSWTTLSSSTFTGFYPVQVSVVRATNSSKFFKLSTLP